MNSNLRSLIGKFHLKVGDGELYKEAFTHSSYRNENKLTYDYERLEILGDSVLQLVVTEYLFKTLSGATESEINDERKKIVQGVTLTKVSNKLNLIESTYLGKGLKKDVETIKIRADIFESFMGAIFLSEGLSKAKDVLMSTLIEYYQTNNLKEVVVDYKTIIQEIFQKREYRHGGKKTKEICYVLVSLQNNPLFEIELHFGGIKFGTGTGSKKSIAEQEAAKDAYNKYQTLDKKVNNF